MLDLFKELVILKIVSKFRYVMGFIWILIGVVLFVIFIFIEISKLEFDIRCDVEFNNKDEKEYV